MKLKNHIVRTILCLGLLPLMAALASCGEQASYDQETIPIVQKAVYDTASVYHVAFGAYPSQLDTLPIGIIEFDGWQPMEETLAQLESYNNITGKDGNDGIPDFAGENYQILLDSENLPYEDYIEAKNENYLREITVKNAIFLLSNKYYIQSSDKVAKGTKSPCKIILVSSPWASAYGVSDIEQMLRLAKSDVKVVGVIKPAVKEVYNDIIRSKNDSVAVAVLDSYGEGALFEQAIKEQSKHEEGVKYISVINGNLKELATIMSNKMEEWDEEETDINVQSAVNDSILRSHIRRCIVSVLDSLQSSQEQIPLKSIVLGSWEQINYTPDILSVLEELRHYTVNGREVYAHLIDPDLKIIYPLECAAKECYMLLRNNNLLAFNPNDSYKSMFKSVPNYTVNTENLDANGSLSREFKLSRQIGKEEETTVAVPVR